MSPHCEERAWACAGALNSSPSHGAGPFTTLELPRVSGSKLVLAYIELPCTASVSWNLLLWTGGSFPYAFREGRCLLLLFVCMGQTAVQSTRPPWSPWEEDFIVLWLGGDPIVLVENFNAQMVDCSDTCRGKTERTSLSYLSTSGVLSLDSVLVTACP